MQSQTTTQTSKTKNQKKNDSEKKENIVGVITVSQAPARRITWAEDTVDNEHMNKRKSNICCIWHANRDTQEKGLVSDSPSTCSSDDCNEIERSRQSKKNHKKKCSKKPKTGDEDKCCH